MGNVEFDPIVKCMSKRIGNFVYSSWKGRNVIRRYNGKRSKEATPGQLRARDAFKAVIGVWKQMPRLIRKSWKSSADAKAITEYNAFIGHNSTIQSAGNPLTLVDESTMENMQGYAVHSNSAGSVSISYTPATDGRFLSVIAHKIDAGLGDDSISLHYDFAADSGTAAISGLESGAEYYLYCLSTDKSFNESEKISSAEQLKISVM